MKIQQVVTYLKTTLSQKLCGATKRHLYNGPKLSILACNIRLYVCNAFEVRNELFYDGFPCDESFDEDVRWAEVLWSDVLLYE